MAGYNRIQEEHAYAFYKEWTGPGFPRAIRHGDPARQSLLRRLLRRELGQPRAIRRCHRRSSSLHREEVPRPRPGLGRFLYGGSTGGWEALAAQVFYPTSSTAATPAAPIRSTSGPSRSSTSTSTGTPITSTAPGSGRPGGPAQLSRRGQRHARGVQPSRARAWHARPGPATSGMSGRPSSARPATTATPNRSGTSSPARSTARSPHTGGSITISSTSWSAIGRPWGPSSGQGPHLRRRHGQLLSQQRRLPGRSFLESTKDPITGATSITGPGEHCWNGDHERPNAISRSLSPDVPAPDRRTHPGHGAAGADVKSWRY